MSDHGSTLGAVLVVLALGGIALVLVGVGIAIWAWLP